MARNRILPDTCAWIDFFKGKRTPPAETLAHVLMQQEVATCGVVLYELLQGVRIAGEEQRLLTALEALPYLEMTRGIWTDAGRLSASLRKGGHTLPMSDLVIAALAMSNGYAVLTVDRHFAEIPGVEVVQL